MPFHDWAGLRFPVSEGSILLPSCDNANSDKETLETRKDDRDIGRVLGHALMTCCKSRTRKYPRSQGADEITPLLPDPAKHKPAEPPPSYREVFQHQSNLNLLAYTLLALHSIAFDQLVPVFLHLPPQLDRSTNPDVQLPFKFAGGFGLDVWMIVMR